ncbi:spore coat protein CotH [Gordonia pseudamarae]|jgi:spore coat protein CotH|uniref:Spore coat protein CotH n=1 Tax=Gordonia pseudamarae TaxID=2831662 RepID=A0ABX6IE32_9ACTN|nr:MULTISPECIES: CotH kinase family protein [Gordonia]MBD0022843.1 CotH kinase family protein [Gordonia sp. (in: high G+C Gram-positive bacteria)]QHN24712.1 spore coat protein CotH [Gordonia pseudamarae]QHN33643.1 spore coat protein CotH [Gordonia pseudamarae]
MEHAEQPSPNRPPRSRLRHRIPKSVRQHWKIPVILAAFVALSATVAGGWKISPIITGDESTIASEITTNIAGTVDLFDTSSEHRLTIDIPDAEYRDLLDSYEKNGDKDWVAADVVIDGTFINDVAVRLKGNSTLMGLRGNGFRPGGDKGDAGPPDAGQADGAPNTAQLERMRRTMPQVSKDDPTSLPLLLSFNEYYDGRAYQGMTELSVRPGTPVLNEATALSVTARTDQPTQRYSYVTYRINGSETASKLILEHPDEAYADSLFESNGYLYKADANSRLTYVGDDQSDYSEQFTQINSSDAGNLQPIINLARWLDRADDEEFDSDLAQRVDVDSLTKYVATQNLLGNGDDMSGPGQNYYLWYDLATKKFTVISWDLNLAMNGDVNAGPFDKTSIGPGGGNRQQQEKAQTTDAQTDTRAGAPQGQGAGPGGAMRDTQNPLKTRFLASTAFKATYEETYWKLYEQIYRDGMADSILTEVADRVPITAKLSESDRDSAVADLRSWIAQRSKALAAKRSA